MEVIFDTPNLRPMLSPTMRTTLSVISLIANSLVEANKCMKERLADEGGSPTTLDQVMQQSGLKIPGLEEALARLMGGGADATQTASMIVNTPDPVKLLQAFAANYGFSPTGAEPQGTSPIVTPPPAAAANHPPASGCPAPGLLPFRADFTREGHQAAKAAAAASAGLPHHRPDFTREGQQAAQAHVAGPAQCTAVGPAGRLSLVGAVARQLDTIRRHRKSFEAMVNARLGELEAELARLREELDQLRAALLRKKESRADAVAVTETAAAETTAVAATVADAAVMTEITATTDAAVARSEADTDATTDGARQPPGVDEESLPVAATAEEVVQAIELVEEFAAETTAAEAQQLARIAATEQEVARMRSVVQSAREVHAATAEPPKEVRAHG